MPVRLRTEVPSYPILPVQRRARPKVFIPEVGSAPPIGKIPIGLPTVSDDGVARRAFEKEGHPVRNFFAIMLYNLGIVLRSGRP